MHCLQQQGTDLMSQELDLSAKVLRDIEHTR